MHYQEVILMARKPVRLGEKLLRIRKEFQLSQNGILRRLGLEGELTQAEWSAYERSVRVPSLPVVLMIADLAGVWMDVLVNDDLDLPEEIPARPKSGGTQKKSRAKTSSVPASKGFTKQKH